MESKTDIAIFVVMAWLAVTLFIILVVFYYQKTRATILKKDKENQINIFRTSIEAEEKQKEKIAVNLHDEILPLLTALKQNTLQHKKDNKTNLLNNNEFDIDTNLIDQSIRGIRSVALDLMPTILMRFGLLKALEQHIRQLNNKTIIVVFEDKTTFKNEMPFTKSKQINIYRICMEVLSNIQKHAQYKYLSVSFQNTDTNFLVNFRHDGKGVSNEEIKALTESSIGLGLNLLKSRLIILNATINYTKEVNVSTICLSVPF